MVEVVGCRVLCVVVFGLFEVFVFVACCCVLCVVVCRVYLFDINCCCERCIVKCCRVLLVCVMCCCLWLYIGVSCCSLLLGGVVLLGFSFQCLLMLVVCSCFFG